MKILRPSSSRNLSNFVDRASGYSSRFLKQRSIQANQMIMKCGKNIDKGMRLLGTLERDNDNQGIPGPDIYSYNAMIALLAHARQPGKAFEILTRIDSRGLEPNVVTFNTLVRACAQAGDIDRALDAIEEMKARGMVPETLTYNILIGACKQRNDWKRALGILRGMPVPPDTSTFNSCMVACNTAGQAKNALALFAERWSLEA